ncbi:hypothetical protein KUTeg_005634 [Tegillarca granosa]|uniref:Uncharacterized protein n=1 Tax=Tegillarca granosa TaxID=220873 RepID=A0ABQ9FPT3_TEGGR|nr:hypothetical protein KUTeg_005634 [Tegillarca granosa]
MQFYLASCLKENRLKDVSVCNDITKNDEKLTNFEKAQNKEELMKTITAFQDQLKSKINPQNLNRFVNAFMNCPLLVVTGAKASFNHTVHTFHDKLLRQMDPSTKKNVEFLEIEDVANVLEEKPERLAEGFLYLCQGIGVVGGVPMPRVQQSGHDGEFKLRQRSMSMEEADMPKGIYSTSPTRFGSPARGSNLAMSTSPGKTSPMSTSPPKN